MVKKEEIKAKKEEEEEGVEKKEVKEEQVSDGLDYDEEEESPNEDRGKDALKGEEEKECGHVTVVRSDDLGLCHKDHQIVEKETTTTTTTLISFEKNIFELDVITCNEKPTSDIIENPFEVATKRMPTMTILPKTYPRLGLSHSASSVKSKLRPEEKVKVIKRLPDPEPVMKHPLASSWTLWFFSEDRDKKIRWEDCQRPVMSFKTAEDFWSIYNNIVSPSELRIGQDYSLFREGIKPMWEDPGNRYGGSWRFAQEKRSRKFLDERWLDLMLLLIGEDYQADMDEVRKDRTKTELMSIVQCVVFYYRNLGRRWSAAPLWPSERTLTSWASGSPTLATAPGSPPSVTSLSPSSSWAGSSRSTSRATRTRAERAGLQQST